MNNFKSMLNIILGIIAIFFSIAFLSVGLNLFSLFIAGFVIAPVSVILFNKKYKVESKKYYSSLIGVVLASLIIAIIIMPSDTSSKNEIATTSKQKVVSENNKKDEVKQEKKQEKKEEPKKADTPSPTTTENKFEGYKLIKVDGGDLSGHREPNVVVNIGFGNREYYAFTNEHGQLVKVTAKQIILQDDKTEPVNSKGRYYNDEAKVPGTESASLDEGHVIADSLGGVSNAYNITPQNSTLNRHGDQAYMEDAIRKAGGCTDFVAIITYPNTTTQIPSHYSYTYTLNGNVINDEFDNINPDEYNKQNLDKNNNSNGGNSSNVVTPAPVPVPTPQPEPAPSNTEDTSGGSGIVYWTPNGKSYHTTRSCPTLSRSKTILEGTIEESGKYDPCDRCH